MSPTEASPAPVTLFRHGRFHTLDAKQPQAEAMLVSGGRILWAGSDAELGTGGWQEVDLSGAVVLPGLRDAHTHFLSHALLSQRVNLRDATSEDDAARYLAEYASRKPGRGWILGQGWNESRWIPPNLPSRASLDAIAPDRPVLLSRADGHLAWVNTAALQAAGITATTPDPPSGRMPPLLPSCLPHTA